MEIEMTDSYGDLHTNWDVVMAWVILSAVWQKLHPDWPVATIGLNVLFSQKLFTHCGKDNKRVMIEFSNKYLKANSARTAGKKPPMHYEAAFNLSGNVSKDRGYDREPPAWRGETQGTPHGGGQGGSVTRGGLTRNSRGGRGEANTSVSGVQTLTNGNKTCGYWQSGTCFSQNNDRCNWNGSMYTHVCAFVKQGGQVCGKSDHKKPEHDANKH